MQPAAWKKNGIQNDSLFCQQKQKGEVFQSAVVLIVKVKYLQNKPRLTHALSVRKHCKRPKLESALPPPPPRDKWRVTHPLQFVEEMAGAKFFMIVEVHALRTWVHIYIYIYIYILCVPWLVNKPTLKRPYMAKNGLLGDISWFSRILLPEIGKMRGTPLQFAKPHIKHCLGFCFLYFHF